MDNDFSFRHRVDFFWKYTKSIPKLRSQVSLNFSCKKRRVEFWKLGKLLCRIKIHNGCTLVVKNSKVEIIDSIDKYIVAVFFFYPIEQQYFISCIQQFINKKINAVRYYENEESDAKELATVELQNHRIEFTNESLNVRVYKVVEETDVKRNGKILILDPVRVHNDNEHGKTTLNIIFDISDEEKTFVKAIKKMKKKMIKKSNEMTRFLTLIRSLY